MPSRAVGIDGAVDPVLLRCLPESQTGTIFGNLNAHQSGLPMKSKVGLLLSPPKSLLHHRSSHGASSAKIKVGQAWC